MVEPHVRPAVELGDRVLGEELPGHAPGRRHICDVLGAVLAVLVPVPMSGVRPRAAGAVDALGLVEAQQHQGRTAEAAMAHGVVQGVPDGGGAGSPRLRW